MHTEPMCPVVAGPSTCVRFLAIIALVVGSAWPALAQTGVPALTGDDYAEILQLYFRYPVELDSGDAVGYAGLFTEDGSFGDRVGRQALLEFVRGRSSSTVRHAPLTPLIRATADGATGIVMSLFIDVAQSPAVITRVSQYTDTLVKTSQGWRFKTRVNGSADLSDR
jgi:hypothetical protein